MAGGRLLPQIVKKDLAKAVFIFRIHPGLYTHTAARFKEPVGTFSAGINSHF